MAYRNDIFKPGTKEKPTWYYAPAGENFMQKHGLNPGDVVGIRVGPNGENFLNNIDIGNAEVNGITFVNDPDNPMPIEIGWFGTGNKCSHIQFLGNGSKKVQYGFKLWDPKQLGISFGCVGDIEVSHIEVAGAAMGMQLSTKTGYVYPVKYQKAHIHHLFIREVSDEAMYMGWVNDSPILMELDIHDIKIRNVGRDGIQTRNTRKVLIENCDIDGIGLRGDWGHDHAILFGNCVESGVARNNKIRNVHGIGIWNDGFGNFLYENNDIHSQGEVLFTRPFNPDRAATDWGDSEKIGYQTITVKNNVLTSDKGITGAWLYRQEAGKTVKVTATNNKTSGAWNIPAGVVKVLENNSDDVVLPVPSKPTDPVPVPDKPMEPQPEPLVFKRKGYWGIDGKRVYYKIFMQGEKPIMLNGDYAWYKAEV